MLGRDSLKLVPGIDLRRGGVAQRLLAGVTAYPSVTTLPQS